MARNQLKLHAAMAAVLVDASSERGVAVWMSYDELAKGVEEYDLYRRPVDGRHPEAGQIAARARQYPGVFERREVESNAVRLRLA